MIISISGTPATGKTSVAKELSRKLKAKLISIHDLVKRGKIPTRYDAKRKTRIVDVRKLRAAIKKEIRKDRINIIEGHLSHFINADKIVILRVRPDILVKRMRKKGWSKSKIRENIQAEILDTVTVESLQNHRRNKIIEINAANKTPKSLSLLIIKLLNNRRLQDAYRPGKIDWSERFVKYLVREEEYKMSA